MMHLIIRINITSTESDFKVFLKSTTQQLE